MTEKRLYPERDSRELGTYYTDHLLAMTAEGLHHKSDIATQLAWRDKELDELRAQLASLLKKAETEAVAPACCGQLTLNDTFFWHGERGWITKLVRLDSGPSWYMCITFTMADNAQVTIKRQMFDLIPK